MFWYATHVLRFVLVFAVVSRAVAEGWITGYGALGAVVITVIGHGLVASVQLATGPIEALTVLGFNPRAVATLGPFPTGPYIGGFTGGAPFASLVVIAIPILFALVFSDRIPRILPLTGVVWLAFLLQLTAWDAARGALLVALFAGFVVFGWWLTGVLWEQGDALIGWCRKSRLRNPVLLIPPLAAAAVWQSARSGTNPEHEPVFLNPELGQETIGSISIPGFSTRNLGIRLYQYVGGTDVFLQYPLTGLGGANYNYVALEYADRANMIHNYYIGVFAENGLVGGTLLFTALGIACIGLWKTAATEDSPLWLGLLVGLVGFFALQSFQPQYLRPVTMTSLFGIIGVSYGRYLRNRSIPESMWTTAFKDSIVQRALSSAMVSQVPASLVNTLERTLDTSWERSYLRAALLKTMKWLSS
jgi:hypothetical protein